MSSNALRGGVAALTLAAALALPASRASASELVFWSMWNEPEPQAVALHKIMADYTKAHPQTTFKVVWNGRQNQTKLRGALQAGTPIDFLDQDGDQLAGGLQKEGLGYDLAASFSAEEKAGFLPGVLDVYVAKGGLYQLPYIYNTVNFWYSKELLKSAKGAPPKSFEELLGLCATLKQAGKNALVIEGNVAGYNILYFSHYLERLKGPDALVKAFEDKTGAGWADPAVLAAAKASRSLWDAGCIAEDARGFQYPAGQQTIALGDTLGELVGSWLPTELADSAGKDFAWGAFNFPAVTGGAGKATDIEVGLLSFMVLKNAPHAKEAIDFLKYATGEQAQQILVEEGNVGVTHKGVAWPPVLADAYASASEATALTPFGGGLSVPYPDFASTVLNPEFNKMFLGQTTPEAFVATLVAKTRDYWAAKN